MVAVWSSNCQNWRDHWVCDEKNKNCWTLTEMVLKPTHAAVGLLHRWIQSVSCMCKAAHVGVGQLHCWIYCVPCMCKAQPISCVDPPKLLSSSDLVASMLSSSWLHTRAYGLHTHTCAWTLNTHTLLFDTLLRTLGRIWWQVDALGLGDYYLHSFEGVERVLSLEWRVMIFVCSSCPLSNPSSCAGVQVYCSSTLVVLALSSRPPGSIPLDLPQSLVHSSLNSLLFCHHQMPCHFVAFLTDLLTLSLSISGMSTMLIKTRNPENGVKFAYTACVIVRVIYTYK